MNLIFCATPLHVLIARRIIEEHPQEKFYGIFYAKTLTQKVEHYYKELERICSKSRLVIPSTDIGRLASYRGIFRMLSIGLSLPKTKNVFLVNAEDQNICLMLVRQQNADIISFDDGLRNICEPYKYPYPNLGKLYDTLQKYFGVPNEEELWKRRSKHYTIYKHPNNMGPAEFISLFPKATERSPESYTEEVSILLGQPIYELSPEPESRNVAFTERVVKDFGITKYFPHPREKYHISGVEYIDTPLIIEDFLLQEMKAHPERRYKIYSYCSTAVLNLEAISAEIEFVLLKPQDVPDFLKSTYVLFERLGFSITSLPYGSSDLI